VGSVVLNIQLADISEPQVTHSEQKDPGIQFVACLLGFFSM